MLRNGSTPGHAVDLAGLQNVGRLRQRNLDDVDLGGVAAICRHPLAHRRVEQAADAGHAESLAGQIFGPAIPLVGDTMSPAAEGSGNTLLLAKAASGMPLSTACRATVGVVMPASAEPEATAVATSEVFGFNCKVTSTPCLAKNPDPRRRKRARKPPSRCTSASLWSPPWRSAKNNSAAAPARRLASFHVSSPLLVVRLPPQGARFNQVREVRCW